MHTLIMTGAGLALLAVFAIVAMSLDRRSPGAGARVLRAFIPIWALAALTNGAIGVVRAGIPVSVEIPVFLVVFGIPALAAWLLARRMARG